MGVLLVGACTGEGADTQYVPETADTLVADAGVKHKASSPGSTLYTYVDDQGRIHMADNMDKVPERFADRVVATDTAKSRRERLGSDRVVVLDLRRSSKGKPLNYSVVNLSSRSNNIDYAEPAKSPGRLGRQLARRGVEKIFDFMGLEPRKTAHSQLVILYGAPWCGFCRKAEEYLKSRRIPFVKKNVDSDAAAAMELDRKLRAAGIRGGGIPVLDIKGSLVVGFDKRRIDSLLGSL